MGTSDSGGTLAHSEALWRIGQVPCGHYRGRCTHVRGAFAVLLYKKRFRYKYQNRASPRVLGGGIGM